MSPAAGIARTTPAASMPRPSASSTCQSSFAAAPSCERWRCTDPAASEVRTSTPRRARSATSASTSRCTPPTMPLTADPAGDAARIDATACPSDPCSARPARRPGATASASTSSGWALCTPETMGATSRSTTRSPMRARTRPPSVRSFAPTAAGRRRSALARATPARPMAVAMVGSNGCAGIPSRPVRGSWMARSASCTHAPSGFGCTIRSARPSSPRNAGDRAAAGGEALGAAVEAEAVDHVRSDGAAERGRRLHEDHALAGERAGAGGDEAAHAAADHHDLGRVDLAGGLPRIATHGRGPRCA